MRREISATSPMRGINIDIQPGKGSNDVITRLGAGQADIGQAGMPSVIAATLKGLKAKMFLIAYSTNGDAVFSLKEQPYKRNQGFDRKDSRNGCWNKYRSPFGLPDPVLNGSTHPR